jgi:acid phosphatase family membrane protein YuiD
VEFEHEIILWLQGGGKAFVDLMAAVTTVGNGGVYILAAALLFWCVDRRFGARVFILFMISASLNAVLKAAIHAPRPYWVDPRIDGVHLHSSFGMPSGHAQSAATVFGVAAASMHRRWACWAAGAAVFLIGFSRIVLGVHYPSQVVAGWVLGLALVWTAERLETPVLAFWQGGGVRRRAATGLVVAAGFMVVGGLVAAVFADFRFASQWVRNTPETFTSRVLERPLSLGHVAGSAGAFLGFCLGLSVKWARREAAAGRLWQKALRFGIGGALFLLFFYISGRFRPRTGLARDGYRFLQAAVSGFWISGLAPVLFLRLGLYGHQRPRRPRR